MPIKMGMKVWSLSRKAAPGIPSAHVAGMPGQYSHPAGLTLLTGDAPPLLPESGQRRAIQSEAAPWTTRKARVWSSD